MKSFSALSTAGRGVARQDDRRLCAPGAAARPRDRHTRASLGVVDLEARPCPPVPPAPFTPAAPSVLCGVDQALLPVPLHPEPSNPHC